MDMAGLYQDAGIDAIELSFPTIQSLRDFRLPKALEDSIRSFSHISIHAPWVDARYISNAETILAFNKLFELQQELNTLGVVFHPESVDNLDRLANSRLKVLIENTGARKKLGTGPDFFHRLNSKYNFGYVFDVEHAYENDDRMTLAGELVDIMGTQLREVHVIGRTNAQPHSLVYLAENRDAIVRFLSECLKKSPNIPWICEGVLSKENAEEEARRELEFLRGLCP